MGAGVTVEVQNLCRVFNDEGRGEIRAVDGVSFTCERGEIFGLLGANGAGKTSTLRILSTILQPTSGTARVMGYDVHSEPAKVRASLGFYTASTALYPRLTARETLVFFARINGVPERDVKGRVEELIESFGIGGYAEARVEKLSQGMKQKVSIARTLAHDPPVLILDEPSVGLDVLNAIEMQKVIGQLRDAGKTVVFSTHIMSEAEKLCDRIAIIHKGRILACDTLEGLRQSTGHRYLEDIFVSLVEQAYGRI
ncbi:ABC transporter ATP-binding protein [Desulfobotulus mexicanus]|uniref:ABC transporter ATP-binding protein n=1 Tax=Desulfobotulus mexicanus TaxID=2586642 RepID=UPI001C558AB7|nr:ABC transporter ATP-binding protein [Desulfobotulus mexicanus]